MPVVNSNAKPLVPAPPRLSDIQSKFWFTYDVPFTNVGPGTTQTASLKIHNDSDFEVIKLVSNAYTDSAGTGGFTNLIDWYMGIHYPLLTVLIIENDSRSQLMDISTPVQNIFGTAQQPFILNPTYMLAANSTLSFELSNLYSAQTFPSVTLSFIGRKIYRAGVLS